VRSFCFVKGYAVVFDPGVSGEFTLGLRAVADADANFRAHTLPGKEPPERERLFEAGGSSQTVTSRGFDHAGGQHSTIFRGGRERRAMRREPLQHGLSGAKATPPQTQSDERQGHGRAQE